MAGWEWIHAAQGEAAIEGEKRTLWPLFRLKSRGLVSPEHEGVFKGVYESVGAHGNSKCKQ
jgi:hypothetical protein